MPKIALIIAYFGKFPSYAPIFFETLAKNKDFDLLLFTDQSISKTPSNVKIYTTTFNDLRNQIQQKFDFPICLDRPYKLCDYKPAYGYIFEEELSGYEFWGHCDLDMVVGDLGKFLPDEVFDNYDKIYQHGHLCLYRNCFTNNRRFMEPIGMDHRQVFTSPIIWVFDEVIGMQKKYELLGIPVYTARHCADISPWHHNFQLVTSFMSHEESKSYNKKHQVFFWENGNLYRAYIENGSVSYGEFNYLHFQKRALAFPQAEIAFPEAFFCTNTGFVEKKPGFNVTLQDIQKYNRFQLVGELLARIRYHIFIFKRRFNKYILKK